MLVAVAAGVGCSTAAPEIVEPPGFAGLIEADARAHAAFPDELEARAAAFLPSADSGLIGRNRTWGALYSPRFQLGAGGALRTALAADRPAQAARAFRALEVAAVTIEDDGRVPPTLPPELGVQPSPTDIASGAAFFLGDACLGLFALEAAGPMGAVVPTDRRRRVRARLGSAVAWLLTQQDLLEEADQSAPNRLLFDARSFHACGALSEDPDIRARAAAATSRFVGGALGLLADDGHFVEGGGHDTSYQGVALGLGEDLVAAGYDDARLRDALSQAARWLAGRVQSDGMIDSSDNQRTCGGGETFGGEPKRVAVPEVFAALVYSGVRVDDGSVLEAAGRIANWVQANAGADPCFP